MAKELKKDISEVVEQYLCHSCGSCFTSCGHDSISYSKTVAGYLFPKIDYDTCTNCGLCYDICPGEHFNESLVAKTPSDPFVGDVIGTYIGKSTDEFIYKNSQSGGIVTSILTYLLDSKKISAAIVTTMNSDYMPDSKGIVITSSKELLEAQKSKYIPTNITSLLPKIEKIDGNIAMVGLSCHMHGLENLIKIKKKLNSKIIKIGLVCDRVMLHSSIEFLSKRVTNSKVDNFVFRDTSNSKYPGDITVYSDNKINILDKSYRKTMKNYFTPARCYLCFDKMNIYSDIVVGDPHGFDGIDRDNGESLVITRTSLGESIVQEAIIANTILLRDASFELAIEGQDINGKRKKWNANYRAWEELGYKLPSYPKDVIENSIVAEKKDIEKAKKALKHSLKLDKYITREELIKDANDFYENKTSKKSIFSFIKKLF